MWLERIPTSISHGMNDMERKNYGHSKSSQHAISDYFIRIFLRGLKMSSSQPLYHANEAMFSIQVGTCASG